eukprot:scaffold1368_cov333-Pavlova_lutheri.AAC.14
MQQFKRFVDLVQLHMMGNIAVQHHFPFHGHFYKLWHIHTASITTKGGTHPGASGHQLERPRGDFLPTFGHTDNDGFTPSLVAALQGRTHDLHVAHAFKGVVYATSWSTSHVNDDVLDGFAVVFGVDAVGGTPLGSIGELAGVEVHGDDARSLGHLQPFYDSKSHCSQAEDCGRGSLFHFGGVQHRTDSGGHPTAQEANLGQIGFGMDLGHRLFVEDRVLREGGRSHEVVDGLAIFAEPRLVVCTHHAASGPGTYGAAEVGLPAGAVQALAAEGLVARHDVVSRLHGRDVFTHGLDHTSGFVSQDARKQPFWIASGERVRVGVAQCGGMHLHANFTTLWRRHVHLRHLQRCVRRPCNRGFARDRGRHGGFLPRVCASPGE